ncbi:MAG: multidrug effflux MFS transporter [Rhodoferax sp.]|nr:multidrug effflux MFS transporter [Rhodoferax sp.]MBP6494043.1 multidrug effflux MFS transporter [Rhodoferax sp.]MBP7574284.1 multidrug effflux MFS transporter [Rhodoferax sp.]MBP8135394.1 multidrug effflux MFS transporter [Rhodoferax sp.]
MQDSLLIVILAILSMMGALGIDTYLPSFPSIASTFAVSPVVVQQTLSVFVLSMAAMMLFYGTLSDSFGRRPVLLVSLALFAITSFACALATSAGMLIFLRALQGLSAGAGSVVGRAVVQDHFKGHDAHRATAIMTMVFGLAPVIAPVIGGWLETTLGWRSVFVFLGGIAVLVFIACYRLLPETLPRERRTPFALRPIAANYLLCVKHSRFALMSLSIALMFSGIPLYIGSASAFVMGILHQPETAFAWLFTPMVGGLILGSGLASRFARRVAPARMMLMGFVIALSGVAMGVIYTSMYVARVPYAVMPIMVYTFGLALVSPGMMVRTLDLFPQMSGLAASMQGFIQMLLFSIVAGLVSPMLFDSALKLSLGHAAGVAAGAALWAFANRPTSGQVHSPR